MVRETGDWKNVQDVEHTALASELLHGAESADTAFSAQQRGSAQPLAVSTGARYTSQHAQYSDYIRYGVGIGQRSLASQFW